MDPLGIFGMNLNAGFVALVCNFVVFTVVSLATCSPATIEKKTKAIS